MLTATQIQEARTLLGWTSATLTKRSKVSFATVLKIQTDDGVRSLSGTDTWASRRAFETADIEFTATGARLRKIGP